MKKIKKIDPVECDLCKQNGNKGIARFDTPTKLGPWANLCLGHMASHGIKTSVTVEFDYGR